MQRGYLFKIRRIHHAVADCQQCSWKRIDSLQAKPGCELDYLSTGAITHKLWNALRGHGPSHKLTQVCTSGWATPYLKGSTSNLQKTHTSRHCRQVLSKIIYFPCQQSNKDVRGRYLVIANDLGNLIHRWGPSEWYFTPSGSAEESKSLLSSWNQHHFAVEQGDHEKRSHSEDPDKSGHHIGGRGLADCCMRYIQVHSPVSCRTYLHPC